MSRCDYIVLWPAEVAIVTDEPLAPAMMKTSDLDIGPVLAIEVDPYTFENVLGAKWTTVLDSNVVFRTARMADAQAAYHSAMKVWADSRHEHKQLMASKQGYFEDLRKQLARENAAYAEAREVSRNRIRETRAQLAKNLEVDLKVEEAPRVVANHDELTSLLRGQMTQTRT